MGRPPPAALKMLVAWTLIFWGGCGASLLKARADPARRIPLAISAGDEQAGVTSDSESSLKLL